MGDFNSSQKELCMRDFCETYGLVNLINEPTCYKNPQNPSSIDIILTNNASNFQDSKTIETGLSDHHKMTISVLKTYMKKKDSVKINYRSYRNFITINFRKELSNALQKWDTNIMTYEDFHNIFMKILNLHAPIKQRVIRGNNQPFMNKILSKSFMHRSKLKNVYNKNPTEANKINYKKTKELLC